MVCRLVDVICWVCSLTGGLRFETWGAIPFKDRSLRLIVPEYIAMADNSSGARSLVCSECLTLVDLRVSAILGWNLLVQFAAFYVLGQRCANGIFGFVLLVCEKRGLVCCFAEGPWEVACICFGTCELCYGMWENTAEAVLCTGLLPCVL